MPDSRFYVMAGGGTGGHVIPALAVARELRSSRPSGLLFVGTERGVESRSGPAGRLPSAQKIQVGGLKGIGPLGKVSSLAESGS